MTGGRLKRIREYIGDETFMMTYGDGLCDIDIGKLFEFHQAHKKMATVTSVRPPARFGELVLDGNIVREFTEKPQIQNGWINGGFFIFEPDVFDFIDDDNSILEKGPLERIAAENQLRAFCHDGFWQCMDTKRDKEFLENLHNAGQAPW
jgi:glucose-1-phosphate cytidylyltransferase